MDEIKFNHSALNKLLDDTKEEGIKEGYEKAIQFLKSKEAYLLFKNNPSNSEPGPTVMSGHAWGEWLVNKQDSEPK
jgi:hypothetical protein